jgi:hypothetical protein
MLLLVARRTRDTDEFDELVGAAWPRLRRAALQVTHDPDRAERMARSSLVQTWAEWPQARRGDPLAFAGTLMLGETNLALLDAVDLTPDTDSPEIAPDPAALRGLGERRRGRRRVLAGLSVAAVTVLMLAGVIVLSTVGGSRAGPGPGPRFERKAALTSYERRVLREVPHSYAVNGVVVVPGAIDAGAARNALYMAPPVLTGLTPLGTDVFTPVSQLAPKVPYPDFMNGPPPIDSQVVADVGPGALGCLPATRHRCTPALIADGRGHASFELEVLDATGFLERDVELQVFIRDVYEGGQLRHLIIGGFGGTRATTVAFTMADGSTWVGHVDRGHIAPGATLFWGIVNGEVQVVSAYDRRGRVVNRHQVRPCDDYTSCRVQ